MTLGVRALAFDEDGRVLLVKHTYVSGWHIPGGGVETGEVALDCLRRELLEEANVTFEKTPNLFGFYFNRQASARDHVAVYVCRDVVQRTPKEPDREIIAAQFFPLDALPEDISPATARRINEHRSGGGPAGVW